MQAKQDKLWTKDYIFVMISNFTAAFSYTVFLPVLVLHVNDLGGTNSFAGMITGAMTVLLVASRPIFGMLLDKFGRRPLIIIGSIFFALNTLAYNFTLTLGTLFAARAIHGISQSMYVLSTSTLVADIVPESRLVDGIGYFGVSGSLSGAFGPLVGLAVYDAYGIGALFILMSVFSILGALCAIGIKVSYKPQRITSPQKAKEEKRPLGWASKFIEVSSVVPALILACVLLGYSSVSNFLSSCGLERGISNIGLFFTASSISIILARLFTGKISNKFGFFRTISAGTLFVAAAFIIVAFADSLGLMIAAGIVYGLGNGLTQPLLNVLIFRFCKPERKGTANATFGIFTDLANGLGAAAWGGLTQAVGYMVTYLAAACCALAGFAVNLIGLRPKLQRFTLREIEKRQAESCLKELSPENKA